MALRTSSRSCIRYTAVFLETLAITPELLAACNGPRDFNTSLSVTTAARLAHSQYATQATKAPEYFDLPEAMRIMDEHNQATRQWKRGKMDERDAVAAERERRRNTSPDQVLQSDHFMSLMSSMQLPLDGVTSATTEEGESQPIATLQLSDPAPDVEGVQRRRTKALELLEKQVKRMTTHALQQKCWEYRLQSLLPSSEKAFKQREYVWMHNHKKAESKRIVSGLEKTAAAAASGSEPPDFKENHDSGGSLASNWEAQESRSEEKRLEEERMERSQGRMIMASRPPTVLESRLVSESQPIPESQTVVLSKTQQKAEKRESKAAGLVAKFAAVDTRLNALWDEFEYHLLGPERVAEEARAGELYIDFLHRHRSREQLVKALRFHVWSKLEPAAPSKKSI